MDSTLTRDECRLIQASFAQIEPIADNVAVTFYRRLFELDPGLVTLFKVDMALQGRKLMEKLAVAVMALEDLETISPLIRALGRHHAEYGVRPTDYETAREALLWALDEALGPAFDAELRRAWSAAIAALSVEMIEADGQAAP